MTAPAREELLALAAASGHPVVDLTLGVADPVPGLRLPGPGRLPAHGYPPSAGTEELRAAAAGYLRRRFGVDLPRGAVAACAGAKEFISTAVLFLGTRDGERDTDGQRDTVLVPALRYPAYGTGAELAGCRIHQVPLDSEFRLILDAVPAAVVRRARALWVNSPANPTGAVEELAGVVRWGRERRIPVLSDEAYAETTWSRAPVSALQYGTEGVLAVHSLAKRSNAPGLRTGFYAGDPALVARLVTARRAAGLMASAESQALAAALLDDDGHARVQREHNARRMRELAALLDGSGVPVRRPDGGLFLWVRAPGADGSRFAAWAARTCGLVVMPGRAYGLRGQPYVRIAAIRDGAHLTRAFALLAEHLPAFAATSATAPPAPPASPAAPSPTSPPSPSSRPSPPKEHATP
ncbi:aminotransferase class I/II-fold pyridoxal phosphate-dependent enzyme [Streptomyces sp. TRM66268-LWL]|uniref:Aminotransferase class I/II-fold pyridoxal phosphate-dependent enzyme n=1 Tax=Streptomyces polyasparticus TaxID=2767826 RepID=A0ABR7SKQ6_9ACTN|nr:aminotransferase class I/II-fold pyridoxal phosphate-dependent enzyme [Streptomyces polyasparticus]MBC9716056.1 aminotransferase class I/II-fold pyridoxal phosphate-dependent enzyme [Streptomyces polyasparticus]